VVADAREVRTDRRTGGSPRRRHPGTEPYFGRDVNAGLVSGIEKYVSDRERSYRSGVRRSILLGCSPWFTDVELLRALDLMSFACIVLSKRPQNEAEQFVARKLRQCNEAGKGVPAHYFSELSLTRPKCDDQPIVLSAAEAWNPADYFIPMFRTLGERKRLNTERPMYGHAKLALLGTGAWTDEGPEGSIGDFLCSVPSACGSRRPTSRRTPGISSKSVCGPRIKRFWTVRADSCSG
jgi:hypothetical protein